MRGVRDGQFRGFHERAAYLGGPRHTPCLFASAMAWSFSLDLRPVIPGAGHAGPYGYGFGSSVLVGRRAIPSACDPPFREPAREAPGWAPVTDLAGNICGPDGPSDRTLEARPVFGIILSQRLSEVKAKGRNLTQMFLACKSLGTPVIGAYTTELCHWVTGRGQEGCGARVGQSGSPLQSVRATERPGWTVAQG